VKSGVEVSETFFAGAKTTEIFHRFRDNVRPEEHDYPAFRLLADLDVEVYLRVLPGLLELRLKQTIHLSTSDAEFFVRCLGHLVSSL
jgi:hypothetical protein